jgi:hypothetical protein
MTRKVYEVDHLICPRLSLHFLSFPPFLAQDVLKLYL